MSANTAAVARPIRSRSKNSGSNALAWNTRACGISSATSRARSARPSTNRTRMPRSSSTCAIVVPIRPPPKITMSSTRCCSCEMSRLHARAASGDPMTMIRSPGRIFSEPRGNVSSLPRMMLTTLDSCGNSASRSGVPITSSLLAPLGTSNSTTWTLPSANTSVWRAAGMPIRPEIAFAVSSSDETMKSTSISRSRQASRYSTLVVRTTTRAPLSFLTSIAETRFASSRDVEAMNRLQFWMPASRITRLVVPLPSTVRTS